MAVSAFQGEERETKKKKEPEKPASSARGGGASEGEEPQRRTSSQQNKGVGHQDKRAAMQKQLLARLLVRGAATGAGLRSQPRLETSFMGLGEIRNTNHSCSDLLGFALV